MSRMVTHISGFNSVPRSNWEGLNPRYTKDLDLTIVIIVGAFSCFDSNFKLHGGCNRKETKHIVFIPGRVDNNHLLKIWQ